MGRLVYLPAGAGGPDPDAFLDDVLSGWRQAQLAQNFSGNTVRRRAGSVKQMTEFVAPIHGSGHRRMRTTSSGTCVESGISLTPPFARIRPT